MSSHRPPARATISPGQRILIYRRYPWIIFRLIVKGILIGVSIAAPVGPIGLLVIRRTLAGGRLRGLVSGMGAATADGLYGVVAALGLAAVSDLLIEHGGSMRLAGGAFLLYLGVRTFFEAPSGVGSPPQGGWPEEDPAAGLWGAYASTLGLTLTNPMTILAFAGILAGLGAEAVGGGLLLVAGVFSGSALWWLALSTGVGFVRRWLQPGRAQVGEPPLRGRHRRAGAAGAA